MISLLKNMYNNGNNQGDTIISCKDGTINCHYFVITQTSYYLNMITENDTNRDNGFNFHAKLDFSCELVNIVVTYLYSEKIIDKYISCFEIIDLINLICKLEIANDLCDNLVSYYMRKFPEQLTENNWLGLLRNTYENANCAYLTKTILDYYKNDVLENLCTQNKNGLLDLFKILYDTNDKNIQTILFALSLDKIIGLNEQISNFSSDIDTNLLKSAKINNILKNSSEDDEDTIKKKKSVYNRKNDKK